MPRRRTSGRAVAGMEDGKAVPQLETPSLDALEALAFSPSDKGTPATGTSATIAKAKKASAMSAETSANHDAPWDTLLQQGSKCASDGGVKDSVAARGLLKGAKAARPGLEVRVLQHVQFLPSHENVARAMQLISRGEVHAARAVLGHDDVSTTAAFCKQWHKQYKVPVPPMLESAHAEQLSSAAKERIRNSGKRSAPLAAPLVVETCTKDPQLVGCHFGSGAELGKELGEEATYAMRVCSEEHVWVSGKELRARLDAEHSAVFGSILISDDGSAARLRVRFFSDQACGTALDDVGFRWQIVIGQQPSCAAPGPASSSPTEQGHVLVALGVSRSLLASLSSQYVADGGPIPDSAPVAVMDSRGARAHDGGGAPACLRKGGGIGPDEDGRVVLDDEDAATDTQPDIPAVSALAGSEAPSSAAGLQRDGTDRPVEDGARFALFPPASLGTCLQAQSSRLKLCIRRGFPGLCGRQPLLESCAALLSTDCGGSGSSVCLWALVMAALQDVTPYLSDPVGGGEMERGQMVGRKRVGRNTEALQACKSKGGCKRQRAGRRQDESRLEELVPDAGSHGSGLPGAVPALSVPELVGLALIGKADSSVKLANFLQQRVLATAMRLQSTCATMPWRGWSHLKSQVDMRFGPMSCAGPSSAAKVAADQDAASAPLDLSPWGGGSSQAQEGSGRVEPVLAPDKAGATSDGAGMRAAGAPAAEAEADGMLNAMRVGAMVLASGTDADCLSVYIKAAPVWRGLIKPLAPLDDDEPIRRWPKVRSDTDSRLVKLNVEATVASYGPSVVPNMLLFVQAGLPFAPRHARQHSLQGLARAFIKLSSGANQRQDLPLLLERVAAFRGRDVLEGSNAPDAITQPDINKPNAMEEEGEEDEEDPGTGTEAGGTIELYTSARQVVAQGAHLSPHESTLLDVMQSISKVLLHEHAGTGKPPPQPSGHAFTRARGTGGRRPSAYESRAAFLMLFGDTHHLNLKLPGSNLPVAITVAGEKGRALLVQRLGADDVAVEAEGEGEGDARVGAEAVALFGFIQDDEIREAALQTLLASLSLSHPHGIKVKLRRPPHGFQWAHFLRGGAEHSEVHLRIERCSDASDDTPSGNAPAPASSEAPCQAGLRSRRQVSSLPNRSLAAGSARRPAGRNRVKEEGEERKEDKEEEENMEGSRESPARLGDGLRFFVEGRQVEAFNAASLLEPCNEASTVVTLEGRDRGLIRQALYALGPEEAPLLDDAADLLRALQAMAAKQRSKGAVSEGVVADWLPLVEAGRSSVSKQVWRDVLLTITTRAADVIEVAPVNRFGGSAKQAVRPMSEGTVLRIVYALEALYPSVFVRVSCLKWSLIPSGAAFVHCLNCLDCLARHSSSTAAAAAEGLVPRDMMPEIATELWPHQREASDRVLQGIKAGKLGFADASAVGSGKTLTALSTICAVGEHLAAQGVARHGSLVLVPVNELVSEWVREAMQHTRNLHVIEQRANGKLFSATYKRGNPPIDRSCLVISTLARVREHSFSRAAWDFVVIDECLSVQNDTALQTAEAWRQVEASRCGVLLLSATFFRSSYQKLFYMIRMLRSPLPREQCFLTTTLVEHIVCYVPRNRRSWKLAFEAVALDAKTAQSYEASLSNFQRKAPADQDQRSLYVSLKQLLAAHYEPETLPHAVAAAAVRLLAKGRRPLIFANTEKELLRILDVMPNARRWQGRPREDGSGAGAAVPKAHGRHTPSALVVTIHAAAQGLNLQHEADCIICRPQPGDRLEQMKGRIDRPGQARKDLDLIVLMAQGTVEEAEAANIRLCGTFFRHYISPHSRQFEQIAIDANMVKVSSSNGGKAGVPRGSRGSVQSAFRKGLALLTSTPSEESGRKRSAGGGDGEEMEQEEEEEEEGVAIDREKVRLGGEAAAKMHVTSPKGSPSKKAKAAGEARGGNGSASPGSAPWLAVKRQMDVVPRKLAYDLSVLPPAVLDRALLKKAAVHLCEVDPTLRILIKRLGVTCVPTREGSTKELSDNGAFLSLVKGVVFQMISVQCGNAIMERMMRVVSPFTPASLLAVPEAQMCGGADKQGKKHVGLSRSKYGFIKGIASAFDSGDLSLAQLVTLSDKECCQRLCALKGIGEWTAGVFMLHFLNRPDIMLYGDLTVRMALRDLYGLSSKLHGSVVAETSVADAEDFPDTHCTRHLIDEVAENWRPYRTVVNHLMWHYKENPDSFYVVG